jgi:hypothetical protein
MLFVSRTSLSSAPPRDCQLRREGGEGSKQDTKSETSPRGGVGIGKGRGRGQFGRGWGGEVKTAQHVSPVRGGAGWEGIERRGREGGGGG